MNEIFTENQWVKLKSTDFNDKENQIIHIDTRDFYVLVLKQKDLGDYNRYPDYSELKYIDKYLYTKEEISERLNNLFEESGGEEHEWRCLDLKHIDDKMKVLQNWNMKYIRIFRYENTDKFLVCNNQLHCLRRDLFLNSKIIKEFL